MAKLSFSDYAYDDYEDSETVEHLTKQFDWSEEDAEEYVSRHRPLYEVQVDFVYDTETHKLTVVGAVIDGTRLVPEH